MGLVLAQKNPHVQVHVVDHDARRIKEWNSDRVPAREPGVEELMFGPHAVLDRSSKVENDLVENPSALTGDFARSGRPRRLLNVYFSSNVHAGIVASDMVFLCLDAQSSHDVRIS